MKLKGEYPIGKLPMEELEFLLKKHRFPGQRVVIGPGIGKDAAVIDFGQRYLVAKTDPITFVTDEIGYYAVNINANDVVCTGATPKWFLVTLLLPENLTQSDQVEAIFAQIKEACQALSIGLVGGHTEITMGIDRPIVVGQMLGEVEKEKLVKPERIEIGDLVILTKGIAIEGVSILAREKDRELTPVFGTEFVTTARNFLHEPGISVYEDALLAAEIAPIHAFHDPTEGGLATGLYELARVGLVGIEIDRQRIPVLPEAEKLCNHFLIDPLGLIASGSLLIVTDPVDADKVVNHLRENEIPCEIIGEIISPERGVLLRQEGKTIPFPQFERDEITKIFT